MKKTSIFALALVFLLSFGTAAMAKDKDKPVGYEMYYGKVEEFTEKPGNRQILVKNELSGKEWIEQASLYTKEVPVIDLNTGKFTKDYKFKSGELIQFFFKKNTPVLQSLPPKLTPDFIGINAKDGKYSLDVDYFDKEGHGISNRLKINVYKDTAAENLKGESEKDILDNDLAVLYTVATRSLPPITNPDKIIVLNTKANTVDMMDYKAEGKDGILLRKYYSALGAKIEWNQAERSTQISINNKSVNILNKNSWLTIEDVVTKIDGFTAENGVSIIPEKYVEKINNYLLK